MLLLRRAIVRGEPPSVPVPAGDTAAPEPPPELEASAAPAAAVARAVVEVRTLRPQNGAGRAISETENRQLARIAHGAGKLSCTAHSSLPWPESGRVYRLPQATSEVLVDK